MAKIYQKKAENNALFLGLWQDRNVVELRLLTEAGEWYCTLAYISDAGLETAAAIDMNIAARAGIAIDANGRLKVIGQDVEAERFSKARYPCSDTPTDGLEILHDGDGDLEFITHDGDHQASVYLAPTALRRLRDNLSAHLAYLEQEGLA